jgi:hypothetical protein
MDLLKRYRKDQFRPLWRYTASGVLWQIVTDSPLSIVAEDRDLEAREVSYFCLERKTGMPLWRNLRLEEGWWSGIEAAGDTYVIFHGFASPDLPVHRGVTVAAAASGMILWKKPDVRFLSMTGSTLSVARESPGGGEILRLDARTGAEIGGSGNDAASTIGSRGSGTEGITVRLPAEVLPQSDPFARYATLVHRHHSAEELLPPVEWVEQGGQLLCVLHSRGPEGRGVVSRFCLFRLSDGRLLFEEVLGEAADVPAGRSFFVQNDVAYYVQRRSTLVAIPLEGGAGG